MAPCHLLGLSVTPAQFLIPYTWFWDYHVLLVPFQLSTGFFPFHQFFLLDSYHLADLWLTVLRAPTLCDLIHTHGFNIIGATLFFYFLHTDALTSGALLTLEGVVPPGLADSWM